MRLASYTRQAVENRGWSQKSLVQPKKTHLFLDASGKAYVPDNKREELCKIMAKDFWMHREQTQCSIVEIIDRDERFGLCLDNDFKNGNGQPLETRESLIAYSQCMIKTIVSFYKDDVSFKELDEHWRFIGLCNGLWKMHAYLTPCIVDLNCMYNIREAIIDDLIATFGEREAPKNSWKDVVDGDIYIRSLRAPLTRKFTLCQTCNGNSTAKKLCSNEDCVRGRVPLGNETIYAVEFVLKMDGTEDKEMLAKLQGDDPFEVFKTCTVWHWDRPLTPWRSPFGRSLVEHIPRALSAKEVAAYYSDQEQDLPSSSSSSSSSSTAGRKTAAGKKQASYATSVKRSRHEAERLLHKENRVNIVIEKSDERFRCLKRIIADGKLGSNYSKLELTSLMTDKANTIMFAAVRGHKDRFCELATDKKTGQTKAREHRTARIYFQVNRSHPAAIYVRCWNPRCHGKKSYPYFLDGPDFYTLFPTAALPNLLLSAKSSSSSSSSSSTSFNTSASFSLFAASPATTTTSQQRDAKVRDFANLVRRFRPSSSAADQSSSSSSSSSSTSASVSNSASSLSAEGKAKKRRRLAPSNLLETLLNST